MPEPELFKAPGMQSFEDCMHLIDLLEYMNRAQPDLRGTFQEGILKLLRGAETRTRRYKKAMRAIKQEMDSRPINDF